MQLGTMGESAWVIVGVLFSWMAASAAVAGAAGVPAGGQVWGAAATTNSSSWVVMQRSAAAAVSGRHGSATAMAAAAPRGSSSSGAAAGGPVCLGLGNAAVDWWVMLKHPLGYQYSYLDSSMLQPSSAAAATAGGARAGAACQGALCWRHGLTMQNPNPVSHTLAYLQQQQQGRQQQPERQQGQPGPAAGAAAAGEQEPLAYAMYNDEDPAGAEHWAYAHAKGVVAFTSSSGFWLQHSAPCFPGPPSAANFSQLQRPQSVFGQHFFCASFNSSSSSSSGAAVPDLAALLLAAGPYIYAQQLPAPLAAAFPAWARLAAGGVNDTQPHAVNVSFGSLWGRQQLLGFAKTAALHVSLEDGVVPVGLASAMLWETWRRGHDALPSLCPPAVPYSSLNIQRLGFPGSSISWGWAVDHSKWGVSSRGGGRRVVCLGDMNRAAWQAHRGGSYVCLQHEGLWEAFHGLIRSVQGCNATAAAAAGVGPPAAASEQQ